MSSRREYEIAFVGLKPGIHEDNYEITDKFFESYDKQDFSNCKAQIKLTLEKATSFMMLKFEVGGTVDVICDRCGNMLPIELWDEFNVLVKMVENPDEMNEKGEDPDILYISRTESHLHLAELIYEFIILSLPVQKMCRIEEMSGPYCYKEALEMLKKMNETNNQTNNPIWKDLDKFKNL